MGVLVLKDQKGDMYACMKQLTNRRMHAACVNNIKIYILVCVRCVCVCVCVCVCEKRERRCIIISRDREEEAGEGEGEGERKKGRKRGSCLTGSEDDFRERAFG